MMNSESIKNYLISRQAQFFYKVVAIVVVLKLVLNQGPVFIAALASLPFIIKTILKYPVLSTVGLYLFLLPFDSVLALGSGTTGTTLTSVAGLAVIALLFAEGTLGHKLVKPDLTAYSWVLFILFALLSITWAVEPALAYNRIGTAIGLLLVYLILSCYPVTAAQFELLCKIIVYSGVAATLYVVAMFAMTGGNLAEIGRLSVSFEDRDTDANQFAFSLIIPFTLSLKQLFEDKGLAANILNAFVAFLIAFAIILSGSRGGLLSMVVMLAVFFFGMRKSKKKLLILAVITALLVFVFSLLPEIFMLRLTGAVESGGAGRTDIWEVAYAAFKHYFITGIGLNNFPIAYSEFVTINPYQGNYRGSHNIYLCIAVEFGLLGIYLFLNAVIRHYRLLRGRFDYTSTALKAGLVGVLISSFFLDIIWRKPFWLLWILIMMLHNQRRLADSGVDDSLAIGDTGKGDK